MSTTQSVSLSSHSSVAFEEVTELDIGLKPWKYIGYKRFAKFVASDTDFSFVRRFDTLNARVILNLQDQISVLEERLETLDQRYSRKEAEDINNGSFRRETQNERCELLEKIKIKLKDYNDFVIQHSQLRARPPVPKKDISSLENWFWNNKGAILEEETAYIQHTDDLFSFVPKTKTPVRRLLEKSIQFRIHRFWRKAASSEFPECEKGTIFYASDSRIDQFVTATVTAVGLAMIATPLWILNFVESTSVKLGIITGFIVLFLSIVSATTVANAFESLAATAAYSAILMVFMQIRNSA